MNEYVELINKFLKKGYHWDFFSDAPDKQGSLILRHDIDFDVKYAFEMSLVEDSLNVKATYFFLIHSNSYNLLETENIMMIKSMRDRGHKVSIHFDPTIYDSIEEGFQKEKDLFELIFDVKVEYVSIHKPSDYFLNNSNDICGVSHTYQPRYFDEIKYFADSQGLFKYGHPVESKEFEKNSTIQLLIHPIWWVAEGEDSISKLHHFLNYRISKFKEHMAFNCGPYKKYMNGEI